MNPPEFDYKKYFYIEDMKLYHLNGKYLGDIVQDDDGTYLYFPDQTNNGGWNGYQLLGIGWLMYELNLPWQAELETYFARDRDSDGMGD